MHLQHICLLKNLSLIPALLSLQKQYDIVTLVFSDILLITVPYVAVAFIAHYVSAAFMAHYVRWKYNVRFAGIQERNMKSLGLPVIIYFFNIVLNNSSYLERLKI